MAYFPFMIDVSGRKALVVGAGKAVRYKVGSLLDAGAEVTVVAPTFSEKISMLSGKLLLEEREYSEGEASGYDIVIAATDDPAVNDLVIEDAKNAGSVMYMRADRPDEGEFIFPAIIRKDGYSISVSTDGKDPSRAKHIKERLKSFLDSEDDL